MAENTARQIRHLPIRLYDAFRYRASRAATVDTITGQAPAGLSHYQWRYLEVQRAYATQLGLLHDAGYFRVGYDKRFKYALNCPPADVGTTTNYGRFRTCQISYLCPFCYARWRVLQPFKKMETVLYGDDAAEADAPVVRGDLRVLAFRVRVHGQAAAWPDGVPTQEQVVTMREKLQARRPREARSCDHECGTIAFQVWPDAEKRRLSAYRQGVFLSRDAPAEDVIERIAAAGGVFEEFRPNKAGLAKAFSLAMPYASELLTVPAAALAVTMNGFAKFRYQSWVGEAVDETVAFPAPKTEVKR